jgi:hypothetical protein
MSRDFSFSMLFIRVIALWYLVDGMQWRQVRSGAEASRPECEGHRSNDRSYDLKCESCLDYFALNALSS